MRRKLQTTLGFYEPSFLRLHIATKESIKHIEKLTEKAQSIFFHEYIHFLQDLTTYHGLNNIHATVEYMRFANNFIIKQPFTEFDVPIEPQPYNVDNVHLNQFVHEITNGEWDDIDNVTLKDPWKKDNYLWMNNTQRNVPQIIVPFENDVYDDKFIFGAGCITESMAYIFERILFTDYEESDDIPYSSAELLVEKVYPAFGNDILNVLALCDISLLVSNPGDYFYTVLNDYKDKCTLPNTPDQLYQEFISKNQFNCQGATNYNGIFTNISQNAITQLNGYFNDPFFQQIKDWIEDIFIKARDLRLSNISFILDLARGGAINNNSMFKTIFNEIGTPLMTNDLNDTRFYHPLTFSKTIDPNYLWAINQIFYALMGMQNNCELTAHCCASKINIDKRCSFEPWSRSNDNNRCPYALIWYHWGLTGFSPII